MVNEYVVTTNAANTVAVPVDQSAVNRSEVVTQLSDPLFVSSNDNVTVSLVSKHHHQFCGMEEGYEDDPEFQIRVRDCSRRFRKTQ